MTSLHMICGLSPLPIKNFAYAYGQQASQFCTIIAQLGLQSKGQIAN